MKTTLTIIITEQPEPINGVEQQTVRHYTRRVETNNINAVITAMDNGLKTLSKPRTRKPAATPAP